MYRSGVKPWNSPSWRPSEKHIHDKAAGAPGDEDGKSAEPSEVREVREKGDEESA